MDVLNSNGESYIGINSTTYICYCKSSCRTLSLLLHLQRVIEYQSMPSNPMDSQSQANEGPKVDGAIPGYSLMLIVLCCLF